MCINIVVYRQGGGAVSYTHLDVYKRQTTELLGQVKLGDLNAYGVNGATVQRQLEAYLILSLIHILHCQQNAAQSL